MSLKIAATTIALLTATSLSAQAPGTAYIVTRLGVDTVSIERYTRAADKLEGDLALRYTRGGTRLYHYSAQLGPRGEIKSMTTVVRRPGMEPTATPLIDISGTFADSVAVFEVQRAGKRDTSSSGRKIFHGGVAPTLFLEPAAYGPYEQILASSGLGNDSVVYALVGPGAGPVPSIILRRRGADTVAFTSTFFPGWTEVARVDSRGRIMSIDATATTVKTVAERVPNLDFDAIAARWSATDAARGGGGIMSPADTARATIGSANVSVAYSRPAKRGRVIFGNIVPYNQVWRTGANAATVFNTDKDLMFGSTLIPAGKYTLWTVPTPTGAKLIFNSETGQWGTDYHSEKDFTRVDLTTNRLSQPVEQFLITVLPQASGGVLRMAWDTTEYSIPFSVK
ncbi:MAG: DUF2911 domain-containing protein [Gemmatimonadaceae bacterium]